MRHLYLALLGCLLLTVPATAKCEVLTDSTWRTDIKTVQLYRTGAEQEMPVLVMGESGELVLEFDLLAQQPDVDLTWQIVHCNSRWEPDGLEANDFLLGFADGSLSEYDFSFGTRHDYVHYTALLPAATDFRHSGNYGLRVADREGQTVLTRRFWVSEQVVKVKAELNTPYDGQGRERRQEVDVSLSAKNMRLNEAYLTVVVQQNGMAQSAHTLQFSGFAADALTYRFRSPNLFDGGNTFRFFDFSNLRANIYHVQQVQEYGGELFVRLQPEEDRSHKVYVGETTLPGGIKVNRVDRNNPTLEAEYAPVCFTLPMRQPMMDGSVHIVGELTDWKLDDASRMDYDPQLQAYTKCLMLKQGYYAYQLLFKPAGRVQVGATERLEGNHRETPNRYTLFVYHRSPADQADRLLAVSSTTGG